MNIRVMTFNIQHGLDYKKKDTIDLPLMADAIRICGGEIAVLNEVRDKGTEADFTAQAKIIAEELGYHWYFARAIDFPGGPYGNAIVSKYPIRSAETVMIPDPAVKDEDTYYETRCVLKAVVDIPSVGGGLTVLGSHFGLAKAEARNAVAKVLELIGAIDGPYVFMGDLNLEPGSEILRPLFDAMKDTSAAFPKPMLSFPSDKPDRKIDYIFVDRGTQVLSADIPEIVASDHRPHTALIRI